ncbi:polysaccharide biosynthesis tyrosine autokinase [Alkalitalea saponilacus]|uniref:non-specific protein-tyrosine kinase n=1 Tax=Alkalitalea saponilacus TaxID=889453 RepID=A0A1T5D050_9BACT|nr:tyrosine-protein kinase family protein [Alkalitalea saponilacus]ASB50544.1 capsular biosynthesis protein [Alkalitalea saponilacus]SKB65118.1 capsular exopolysaccharide family [Alkalitalea saponilacus]
MAVPTHHGGIKTTPNHRTDGFSDIRKIARLIFVHWYLFVIFIPMGLSAAWLYHRYTVPEYRASITMLFQINAERSISRSVLTEGFGLSPEMRSFENQSFIIRSQSMVRRAIDRLDFGVSYYARGRFKDTQLYNPTPFEIRFDSLYPQLLNTPINIDVLGNGQIQVSVKSEGNWLHNYKTSVNESFSGPVSFDRTISPGDTIQHDAFRFSIHSTSANGRIEQGNYYIVFNSHAVLASRFRSRLSVSPYREGSSIIFISVTGIQPRQLMRFLNVFSEEIIINNLERKNDMATRSIDFIQRQLNQVSDTLQVTQQELMDFRRENRFMMPSEVSQRLSSEFFQKERERRLLDVSYEYFTIIKQRIQTNDLNEDDYLLPVFSSEPAGIVQQFVRDHLTLLNEQTLIAGQAGEANPYQQQLRKQIELSEKTLLTAIRKQMETIDMQRAEIDRHIRLLTREIGDLPELERDFLALERTHKLNDAIYTFLLQKSSEMQIAKASNVPDNEVLDQASVSGPITPSERSNYTKGLMAGLIIPALIIGLKELFNTRIRSREDLQGVINNVPIVGDILRSRDGGENVVLDQSNSVVAESFRSLRAKLRFLLSQNPGKVISVTSTNTGEGKTFCSINLASVFAISGKKTAVVGFDLRKPRLSAIFDVANHPGISNYLIGQVEFEDIVRPTNHENLFVVPAGVIPPNPSELISGSNTVVFFEKLKENFDIIVVDTPPVGLVSDARILMDLAECHLYVVRAGVTNKEHFGITLSNLVAEDVKCIGVVMNDVASAPQGYGYYASGYFQSKS